MRSRHSFYLSYPAEWQEQPQQSNISRVLQVSRHLLDENRYQPTRLGRIMAVQGKDMDLVTLPRNTKMLVGLASPFLPQMRLLLKNPYPLTIVANGMWGRSQELQIQRQRGTKGNKIGTDISQEQDRILRNNSIFKQSHHQCRLPGTPPTNYTNFTSG